MLQQRRKKGFTLAELLIVVAIIAVLTAIAVPLFVSAITKAENATGASNVRAVRGAAVVEILSNQETYMIDDSAYDTKKTTEGSVEAGVTEFVWYVTADVTESGELQNFKIIGTEPTTGNYATAYKGKGYEKSGDIYRIAIKLTELDIAKS